MNDPTERPVPTRVQVKVTDDIVGGVYSNHMVVAHTGEEFFVDFFTMLPQMGKLVARIIVSPGHMKRIVTALSDNLARYEERHGPVQETPPPPTTPPEAVN